MAAEPVVFPQSFIDAMSARIMRHIEWQIVRGVTRAPTPMHTYYPQFANHQWTGSSAPTRRLESLTGFSVLAMIW